MGNTLKAKEIFTKINEHYKGAYFKIGDLEDYFVKEFGKIHETKFKNCHGSLFTLSQLLSFFVMKGKLIQEGERYQVNKECNCACQHHNNS